MKIVWYTQLDKYGRGVLMITSLHSSQAKQKVINSCCKQSWVVYFDLGIIQESFWRGGGGRGQPDLAKT